jgi:hypothetical protein
MEFLISNLQQNLLVKFQYDVLRSGVTPVLSKLKSINHQFSEDS